jgi:hypothetical protein
MSNHGLLWAPSTTRTRRSKIFGGSMIRQPARILKPGES